MTPSPRIDAADGDSLEKITEEANRVVRAAGPGLRTETKWGHPWYVGRDLVCLVGAFTHHVGVEFWRGSALAPAHPMLEGTGKNLRHVKLRTAEEARSKEFQRLVKAAIQLDQREEKRAR
jgi:hypothetical protein